MSSEGDGWGDLPGRLIVISGPSGSGKSTLVRRLARAARPAAARVGLGDDPAAAARRGAGPRLRLSQPRAVRADSGRTARVGPGPRPLLRYAGRAGAPGDGRRVSVYILVIDVQGGFQVRQKVPQALLVFVQPPSLEVLEDRLRARGTDDEATIERRLANARREIEMAAGYDVHVINDELDRAVDGLAVDPRATRLRIEEKP